MILKARNLNWNEAERLLIGVINQPSIMGSREADIAEGVGLPGHPGTTQLPGAAQPGRAFVLSFCAELPLV